MNLMNMVENTVQLIQRVIADDHFTLARGGVLHLDLGAELLAELAFELADVRVGARARLVRGRGWLR